MRQSSRLAKKQNVKLKNEAHEQPKAKKSRSDDNSTIIFTIDNDIMMESFKYLNYYQLAKNSLVSKRFRAVIQTHRHLLPLLDIDQIRMSRFNRIPAAINIFGKQLSPEAYNEWVIRNQYSKQIRFEGQITEKESPQHDFIAYADNNVFNRGGWYDSSKCAFLARAQLNDQNWPLFQHFVCLLTDPFIRIRFVELTSQNVVLNLLAEAMNPNCNRLQCEQLIFNLDGDIQKFVTWVKHHVQCNELEIYHRSGSNCDPELLDFFVTGARCAPEINVKHYDLYQVVVNFMQKFMGLKNRNEYQMVESTRGNVKNRGVLEVLKRNYSEFIEEEKQYELGRSTRQIIRFINNDIEKRLTLTVTNFDFGQSSFSIKITNM